jgi:hypothetical protein
MASAQIIHDFESGTLSEWTEGVPGRWKSDTSESLNGNFSLHHQFDNPVAGTDCIGLPLTNFHPEAGSARWSFLIRHGYNPSASNKWAVYLMSDIDPVSFANRIIQNGFSLGVNLSGTDDTLKLWKIKEGELSVVISCPVDWENDIGTSEPAKLIVERSFEGHWTISVFNKQDMLMGSGSGINDELFYSGWLILDYNYTKTSDRLLWLDDLLIEGVFYEDKTPPEIKECIVRGNNSIEINFNEEPDEKVFLTDNYSLNEEKLKPEEIIKVSAARFLILFKNEFKNKVENSLVVNNLCDRYNNCAEKKEIRFTPVWAARGDVIITEIMADPVPPVSLPEKEYIEIINTTDYSLNLKNFSLSGDGQKAFFPDWKIDPGEYNIVCPADNAPEFSIYGKTIGLKSFPVLTDGGKMLVLADSLGEMIHGLKYSTDWYGNNLKKEGGWSLEMIDTRFPFFTEGNWEASSSGKGGTPGFRNSVSRNNPDLSCYGIRNLFPSDSITIRMTFSETISGLAGNTGALFADGISFLSVSANDPLLTEFVIITTNPMIRGEVYKLYVYEEIGDFAGNQMDHSSFSFGLPESAGRGSLVFNEILFNPYPEESDYIEFYNTSDKVLDASRIFVASINSETGDTSELYELSDEHRCIVPGSFYVATTDKNLLLCRYLNSEPDAIFEISQLPSMPDDKGHLILLNRNLEVIDEIIYTDEMHFPLLANDEGISLEKVRPGVSSVLPENWHSASENVGWGTPGKENSVASPVSQDDERIVFSSEIISPDNDGNEDVLVIDINPEGMGNVISVTIFDETGNYMTKLAESFFAGTQATLVWDATDDNGSIVARGIYIILIELYNDKGRTKSWKKVCAVIR